MRRLLMVVGLLWLLVPTIGSAQTTPKVHWANYGYLIEVQKNGDLAFTETQELVIDSGPVRKGSLQFNTGNAGQARQILVAEDGQPYTRANDSSPGSYTGTDTGSRAQISYYFRDPNATRHKMTISYVFGQVLQLRNNQPNLNIQLFCSGTSCPQTERASVEVRFVNPVSPNSLTVKTQGFSVQQSILTQGVRLEATAPAIGTQLQLNMSFPSSLVPAAQLRTGSSQPQTQPNLPPASGVTVQPVAPRNLTISPLLCVVVIFFLFIVINVMRSSGRQRRTTASMGPMLGGPMIRRRRRGFFGWGGGWDNGYGGYGQPPIFGGRPYDPGNQAPTDNSSPGWSDNSGGGQSWSDNSGGGQSWSDNSGGGSSWSDSSSGGSSWSDSSFGGGGDSGGSFGGDNNSSFS